MSKQPAEIKKLANIANDKEMPPDMRTKAIEQLGNIGTHEALLALLSLAGSKEASVEERELALNHAREIIVSGHQ